jgi:hypothetical protein
VVSVACHGVLVHICCSQQAAQCKGAVTASCLWTLPVTVQVGRNAVPTPGKHPKVITR